MAIASFADREAERFFATGKAAAKVRRSRVAAIAKRKLDMLRYADVLGDLRSPPGNRLEALRGDLQGLHSMRINDQRRIVFRWTSLGPADVRIRDYHRCGGS